MTETVFTSIVGCPNVGKSSILNRILGRKVAIVTQKPQTTRTKITGVLTSGETQYVFTDTPGFHRPHNVLDQKMMKAVGEGISGMDACLFVTEPFGDIREEETELLKRLKRENAPVVLAINKTDTVKDKEIILRKILKMTQAYDFAAVVPVSAKTGDNIDALLEELSKFAYESPHFFPDDALTDQPERVIAAEIIREKMLLYLDKEVPHGAAVSIERMRDRPQSDITDIDAEIYCEKESHKGIIIGKGGAMLKKISSGARADMERFFGCRINLQCHVKVKEDWRNREGLIRNFGLD
ncbi:MAG: GTPase Era [Clostridia bacterium]|nr:GTPase Era [Clostridia bacterium]